MTASLPTSQLGRIIPTDAEMDAITAATLRNHCALSAAFTAHDITQALRQLNPSYEIDHGRVQVRVHQEMAAPLAAGLYTRAAEQMPARDGVGVITAQVYRSITTTPTITVSVPQNAASAPVGQPAQQGHTFGPAGLLLAPGASDGQ